MLSFSRQIDINYFQGDPSRLGHPQGLREQHPDGVQQDSTFSPNATFTYYIRFMLIFQDKPIKTDY